MKKVLLLALALCAGITLARLPGPETGETKWLMPGLEPLSLDAESSHTWDARYYRVDVDLPMTNGSMNAHCGVWLTSRVPALDTVQFDFTRLVCDSVKHGDQVLDFYDSYLYLDVYLSCPLPEGDSAYIDIWYHRVSSTPNTGFYYYLQGSGNNRNHSVCYSMAEPEDSRYWYPCWDQPWDKAEQGCQVNITVPDSFKACSNGLLDSVTTPAFGLKTYWWTHHYPIPTYLINFAASRFALIQQRALASVTDSIPVLNYCWPEDSSAGMNSFSKLPDMIEFYSRPERFGEYPFLNEKYGQVAVYPFSFGGMEHQTMTTIHRQWVTYGSESGIAHELGHMWYGDNVTCHDWREIWINEGGASYLDPLWMHHYYGHSQFLQDMDDYAGYFFQSDQQDRHPIYNPGLARLFEYGHTYCKAAWVNHMLRYVEADTVFDAPGIWWSTERAFLDSFAYGTATTEDRKRVHEELTGLELDWFFEDWVFQGGFPDYTVNWFNRETTDGWQLVVDIGQDNGSGAPDCFRMPVELRATVNGTDTLLRWDIAANPQRNVFAMPAQVTGVVFDPGDWILHKEHITSGIENELKPEVGVSVPTLHQLAPNPATGPVAVRFSLPHALDAELSVLDAAGRQVRTLARGHQTADRHTVTWNRRDDDGREVAAGLYFVRLEAGDRAETRKLILR